MQFTYVFFHSHHKMTKIININVEFITFVCWMTAETLQEQIHLVRDAMTVQAHPPLV